MLWNPELSEEFELQTVQTCMYVYQFLAFLQFIRFLICYRFPSPSLFCINASMQWRLLSSGVSAVVSHVVEALLNCCYRLSLPTATLSASNPGPIYTASKVTKMHEYTPSIIICLQRFRSGIFPVCRHSLRRVRGLGLQVKLFLQYLQLYIYKQNFSIDQLRHRHNNYCAVTPTCI